MIGFLVFSSIYLFTILLARQLDYFTYIRNIDIDRDGSGNAAILWYIPLVNIIFIGLCSWKIFLYYFPNIKNPFKFFHGENWDVKKEKYIEKRRQKQFIKHKNIDPYGEEDWNEK